MNRNDETALARRELALDIREQALRALAEANAAHANRERLLAQMREANERLVIATVHAEDLVERALAARAAAAENANAEAERRARAEALATQLAASETALRASEREARSSSRAKDDFLATLGHELRTPLASIRLALDLIREDHDDRHRREHAIIDRQLDQLVRLVDDLLDLARVRTGKVELRRRPIEIYEIVMAAVETARPLLESKQHRLTVEVANRDLAVDGDPLRLTQAVSNLLTNAAKYTPSGSVIAVTGECRGANVVVRVRDTGIGISPQMLPRVFDRFAQEVQPGHAPAGGLGLGLAIVRSLVALHGGTVTAASEGLGRGSEFVIELPALRMSLDDVSDAPHVR